MTLHSDIDQAKRFLETGRSIPQLLNYWATQCPDKTFLTWEPTDGSSQRWSYLEFQSQVEALAAGLCARGVTLGDKILLHMDNCPEFLLSWFACARIGAVAVSTNTRSVDRDIEYFAQHAEVVAALTQPRFAQRIADNTSNLKFLGVTETDSGSHAVIPNLDHEPFNAFLQDSTPPPPLSVDAMSDLGIQFTSGTTSRPKAVLWTHANALWGAQLNAQHFHLKHDAVCLTFLPLFHTNAQSYSMLSTLWVGGTLVLQPKFSASRFWEVSLRNQCNWASMIPFCVKALTEQPVPATHDYELWVTAVRLTLAEQLFNVKTLGLWGMTETISHGIIADYNQLGPDMGIGRPSLSYDIAVRDEAGNSINAGERGRLFIRGTRGVSLFKEYFNNETATRDSFDQDGWFDTGDMIRMDDNGDLFFSDRDKDMLKVGGENVAASEIESVIMETGLVSECAVVGQKHFMLDEVPVVFVIAASDNVENLASAIIDACEKNLPDFKVVRDVHVVDDLPRATLEKIAKNELRERLPEITE